MLRIANILLLFAVCTASQLSANPPFEGIGPFKMGRTPLSIIRQLENELECRAVRVSNIHYTDKAIAELVVDHTNPTFSPALAPFCPDLRVFYLRSYTVAGIPLESLTLKFYKGVLVYLECDGNETLSNAMKLKYGTPELLYSQIGDSCPSRRAVNEEWISRWGNETITATDSQLLYYDSCCQQCCKLTFTVSHVDYYLKACKHEKLCADSFMQQQQKEVLTTLNDF